MIPTFYPLEQLISCHEVMWLCQAIKLFGKKHHFSKGNKIYTDDTLILSNVLSVSDYVCLPINFEIYINIIIRKCKKNLHYKNTN